MRKSVSEQLVCALGELNVRQAFGIIGGAAAFFADALAKSEIEFIHCRHENGAAFAAMEAHFASGRPTVVVTTTGPGVMNALTGLQAARWEGAKVLLISAGTSGSLRGRWAVQETSSYTMPLSGLYTAGPIFDFATTIEQPAELPAALAHAANGFARLGGFVGHICLPTAVQSATMPPVFRSRSVTYRPPAAPAETVAECARVLSTAPFVIWVGFGARHASDAIRGLAEKSGAPVMCSPRAKGVFPEHHPQFLGVTGLGGHGRVDSFFAEHRPAHVLVLGTRLGEATSYWQDAFVPSERFIHVDLDPSVPGSAYASANTLAVHADIGEFLTALIAAWPSGVSREFARFPAIEAPNCALRRQHGPVRACVLMDAIQRLIVDRGDVTVMAESGNAFAWANHLLKFSSTGRYRVSVGYGSMGHMAAGVVGCALGSRRKAVAIVGDCSMLMQCEINTAVQHKARAVWVVMNDARFGMPEQGMRALGLCSDGMAIPRVDFAAVARGMGADGVRVEHEYELDDAIRRALDADGPFVVDVSTDPTEPGPWIRRIQNLIFQKNQAEGLQS